jgi:hypothetical protein
MLEQEHMQEADNFLINALNSVEVKASRFVEVSHKHQFDRAFQKKSKKILRQVKSNSVFDSFCLEEVYSENYLSTPSLHL